MLTTDRGNRDRWVEIVKQTGKCPYCPKHGGDNRRVRKKHGTQKPRTRIRRGT